MIFKISQDQRSIITTAFITAILSYFLVYGFELTHFTLSIDEEPLDNFLQTLSAGRWGHALLRHYVLPEPYVPFFTTAFSLIILSISAAGSAVFLGLNKLQAAAFVIMLAAIPQFAYQLEFSNQADTVALSFLCSVLSLFMLEKRCFSRIVFFVVLTIISLAIYQSIFLYAATLLSVKLTLDSLRKEVSFSKVLKQIGIFGVLLLIALIINSFLSKWVASFYNVQISSYLSSMIGWGKNSIYITLRSVLIFIRDYLTFKSAYGMNAFPFASIWLLIIIFLAFKNKCNPYLSTAMAIITLLSGFLLNFAIGSDMPPRTMTQIPLVFAGLFVAILIFSKSKPTILIVPIIFLCVGSSASNKLFYSDYMARQSDNAFASQLITAIYQKYPNFDERNDPVYFYGSYSPLNIWKIPTADVFGSSFFEWDGGNNRRMYMYLSTSNIIKFAEPNQQQVNSSILAAKEMKSWPNRDSISRVNGVVIVKLSDKLSPYNR